MGNRRLHDDFNTEPTLPMLLTLRVWVEENKHCASLQGKAEIVGILDAMIGMIESERRAIMAYIEHQEDAFLELSEQHVDLIRLWHGLPPEVKGEILQ